MEVCDPPLLLVLTSGEEQLFELILSACALSPMGGTVARVCGGWVRDKVLGLESHDVDVTVNNMTGAHFAELVRQVQAARGVELSKLCVIAANPDQSKHLETATMRVLGVDVDFASLRVETYASDSRIPTVEARFGSALEDAQRRDLTINTLFYNINTQLVEDVTGRGLRDLRCGLVCTPVNPLSTFTDDPLRVLRAVRFASRFNFSIDAELCGAARTNAVHAALRRKVSNERVGIETFKCLDGPRPTSALLTLVALGLHTVVFGDLRALAVSPADELAMWSASTALLRFAHHHIVALGSFGVAWGQAAGVAPDAPSGPDVALERCADDSAVLLLALVLSPLVGRAMHAGTKKQRGTAEAVVMDALKSSRRIARSVQLVVDACPLLCDAVRSFGGGASAEGGGGAGGSDGTLSVPPSARLQIGLAMRALGELWPTAWRLATLVLVAEACGGGSSVAGEDLQLQIDGAVRVVLPSGAASPWSPAALAAARASVRVCNWLVTSKLGECWKWRPLLNGAELMALGIPRGSWVGAASAKLIEWQIIRPLAGAEECRAWVAASLAPELQRALAAAPPPPTKKEREAAKKARKREHKEKAKRRKEEAAAAAVAAAEAAGDQEDQQSLATVGGAQ